MAAKKKRSPVATRSPAQADAPSMEGSPSARPARAGHERAAEGHARDALVRFGVAMESSLLDDFDALVETRGSTRSELLRDLARAEITRTRQRSDVAAVGTLTLVYDHHVRDLGEKLTEMQHDLGDQVRSTLHVHLDHDHCLEVIVLMGRARHLHEVADRLLATKGVKHGALELVPITREGKIQRTTPSRPRLDGAVPHEHGTHAHRSGTKHDH